MLERRGFRVVLPRPRCPVGFPVPPHGRLPGASLSYALPMAACIRLQDKKDVMQRYSAPWGVKPRFAGTLINTY